MDLYPVDLFFDAQGRALTAPSKPLRQKGGAPSGAHLHGSYAHVHAGSHLPHKHVTSEAQLCRPGELTAATPPLVVARIPGASASVAEPSEPVTESPASPAPPEKTARARRKLAKSA